MFTPTIGIEQLEEGQKKPFEINGIKILMANINGVPYAVQRICSHAESDLAEGNLEGCVIECPLHGAMFDMRDGKVLSLPATQPLKSFPAKIENGIIMVDVPELEKEETDSENPSNA